MDKDELERTNLMKTMILEQEQEETSIVETIEEFEERLEYMDIPESKKNKLKETISKIKQEESDETREYLFKLLVKEVNND